MTSATTRLQGVFRLILIWVSPEFSAYHPWGIRVRPLLKNFDFQIQARHPSLGEKTMYDELYKMEKSVKDASIRTSLHQDSVSSSGV